MANFARGHAVDRHVEEVHVLVQCVLSIPGMIGEAVVLSNFATFMPKLHAASGSRYGAFLFATYALVLGLAEIVTLRAKSTAQSRSAASDLAS